MTRTPTTFEQVNDLELQLNNIADARKIIADLRQPFAGNNKPVWDKLYNADNYLAKTQKDLVKDVFADPEVSE